VPSTDAYIALQEVLKSDSRTLFARLARALGDFDHAEDALQDAVHAATVQWPNSGVPPNPKAWLYQTARFKGIDALRKRGQTIHDDAALAQVEDPTPSAEPNEIEDELLRLIFTCCHPTLSPEAQIALTLREVCGLRTEDIAEAFLTPAPTMAQRIVRAKAKIREANIPFECPPPAEFGDRLESVLKTIYLVFSEGYFSSSGTKAVQVDLIEEALHLTRQLASLVREPEVLGLLALIIIHRARLPARLDAVGELVLLEHQDRSLWDREAIEVGSQLVLNALRSQRYGPYTLQAAIAAVHAESPSYEATDWTEIVGLYDALLRVEPSPVVALNRAVAVSMVDGPEAGLELIKPLVEGGLSNFHLGYLVQAELYQRMGEVGLAQVSYEAALAQAKLEPERRQIQIRLADL
jgi:RNA polymerase sigma-70 factor (ECF subfamily)